MADATQTALTVGLPTLAVLIGILVNNSRLSDLRGYMESRFKSVDERFNRVENSIDARFSAMEKNLDARFNATDQLFQERLKRVEEVMDARLSRIEAELHIK